jgi:transcriptional regulator of arginine metabolism
MPPVKSDRHHAIRSLLHAGPILSQGELRQKLAQRGFDVTQATLSRDIRDLQIFKGPRGYAFPNGSAAADEDGKPLLQTMLAEFGVSVDHAGNQLVVRTTTGGAQPVAASLDDAHLPGALGTIAGDDTILVICADRKHAVRLRQQLEGLLEP